MTANNISAWENEFLQVNLTDLRLKNRLFKIMDAFWESPSQSVWSATNSRNQAKAAYRFWSNPNISKQELMDSISRATIQKMKLADAQCILIIQDTTSVSFGSERKIDGMGYYCDSEQKGMMVHSCIAVTDTGISLGLLCQETYTRETKKVGTI